MKNNKVKFWIYYHAGLAVFSLIMSMIFKFSTGDKLFSPEFYFQAGVIFITSVFTGYTAIYLVEKHQKYSHSQLTKKVIPALILFYIAAYLISQTAVILGTFISFLYYGKDLSDFFAHLVKYELSYANYQLFLWLMFFTLILFFILWSQSVKREQKLNEEKLKYRYNNLKAQINPHFLFNSLNTLSELVYSNADTANEFIQKLSNVYRYIIENEKKDLVLLSEEINLIKNYFDLQKIRAKEKIQLSIDCENTENYKIIPVSLQILIENAIKHNSFSKENPLIITVQIKNNYVVVVNTLQLKTTLEPSPGTGLKNLKERIALAQKREVIIETTAKEYSVKIPIERITK